MARRGLELEPEVQRYVGQDGAGPAWVRRVKPKAARSGPEWEGGWGGMAETQWHGMDGDGTINVMEIMDVDGFEWT